MIKKSCVTALSKKLREFKKTFPLKTMIKIIVIEIHISETTSLYLVLFALMKILSKLVCVTRLSLKCKNILSNKLSKSKIGSLRET